MLSHFNALIASCLITDDFVFLDDKYKYVVIRELISYT